MSSTSSSIPMAISGLSEQGARPSASARCPRIKPRRSSQRSPREMRTVVTADNPDSRMRIAARWQPVFRRHPACGVRALFRHQAQGRIDPEAERLRRLPESSVAGEAAILAERHRGAPEHPHRRRHRLGQDHACQCADRPYGGQASRRPAGDHRGYRRAAMRSAQCDDHAGDERRQPAAARQGHPALCPDADHRRRSARRRGARADQGLEYRPSRRRRHHSRQQRQRCLAAAGGSGPRGERGADAKDHRSRHPSHRLHRQNRWRAPCRAGALRRGRRRQHLPHRPQRSKS